MTYEYENTLRKIITLTLGSSDDTNYGVTSDRIEKWKEKREIETKKYIGVLAEKRLIYYSDFYDLKNIINKNWETLKPILNDKKRFEVFFQEVEKYRNTTAHGRELFLYQQDLLNGIIKDLQSSFVIYHNKNMDANDYFVRILKISDSIGTVQDITDANFVTSNKIIRVGDIIEFIVEAIDPKGGEIEYSISTEGLYLKTKEKKFSITVNKAMIGKFNSFRITAKTNESEYDNSGVISIHYTILP